MTHMDKYHVMMLVDTSNSYDEVLSKFEQLQMMDIISKDISLVECLEEIPYTHQKAKQFLNDMKHIKELRDEVRDGTYNVSSENVAAAIMGKQVMTCNKCGHVEEKWFAFDNEGENCPKCGAIDSVFLANRS